MRKIFLLLASVFLPLSSFLFAATSGPAVLKAKQEAEGKGDQMAGKGRETFGKAKEKVDEMVDKFRK